jgi:hypothetical protein
MTSHILRSRASPEMECLLGRIPNSVVLSNRCGKRQSLLGIGPHYLESKTDFLVAICTLELAGLKVCFWSAAGISNTFVDPYANLRSKQPLPTDPEGSKRRFPPPPPPSSPSSPQFMILPPKTCSCVLLGSNHWLILTPPML